MGEDECGVGVVDGDEHGGDGDCHGTTVRAQTRRVLLRSCSVPWRPLRGRRGDASLRAQTWTVERWGRVATIVTHAGTTSRWRWSRARYCDGVSPTISVKRELNEPSDVQPTAKQVSVTDMPWRRWNLARSMRRVIRYEYGVSPYAARNLREKCAGDISAARAMAGTSSGSAYSRSMRSRARRRCARLASSSGVTAARVGRSGRAPFFRHGPAS